jgi:outer membrane immunogenic protein
MKIRLIACATFLTLIGGSAIAADLPMKAPPPPVLVPTWTGFYIGVNAGGVWGTDDPNLAITPNGYFAGLNSAAVAAAGSQKFNNSGGLAGGQIGYLQDFGAIIAGLEAGFDWMGLRGSQSINQLYPTQACGQAAGCAFSINQSGKTDWMFTLLGRVGANAGAWFPYITGGLAVANLKYSHAFFDNNTAVPVNTALSLSQTQAGFALGAGIEWKWDAHWMFRAEYLYTQFSGVYGLTPRLVSSVAGFPAQTNYAISSGTFIENIGRVAVSYKF